MIQEAPDSWIDPEAPVELYGFPDLKRWDILTIGQLMKYHLHEFKNLKGMPKDTASRIVFLLKKMGKV